MKVIIFGTGSTSDRVRRMLKDRIEIVAYLDNDKAKWNGRYNNVNIFSPEYINKLEYDYIIIASQYNMAIYNQLVNLGVNKNLILQFYVFSDMYNDYFSKKLKYLDRFDNIELLATGISYGYAGLREDKLIKPAFNLSYPSQDLYYGFELVRKILSEKRTNLRNVKYCIIGLCYYSFQYDLSSSSIKNKIILYYDYLKKAHNYGEIDELYDMYKTNLKIANEVFDKNSNDEFDFQYNLSQRVMNENEELDAIGKKQAEVDGNKNYPETVKENKMIFENYLELLTNNGIKPIVVIYPASKYYTKYFSQKLESEFKMIIMEAKNKYNFQYIDYFKSDLFEESDFRDVSHLNCRGAEKFTQILNEKIEW